jgi:hypothetical protein
LTTFHSFGAAATAWQNFYLLVGTAAATLAGLMFIAVTFGSDLVTPETSAAARSFLDPTPRSVWGRPRGPASRLALE